MWLRKLEYKDLNLLDLRDNNITGEGVLRIAAWVLSIPYGDIDCNREEEGPMQIDLTGNSVSDRREVLFGYDLGVIRV